MDISKQRNPFSLFIMIAVISIIFAIFATQTRIALGATPKPLAQIVASYPRDVEKYLDNISWLAKPVPAPDQNPFWIVFGEFTDEGEKNYLLDIQTGKRFELPSPFDLVGTPDGKFFTVPGTYSGGKGFVFYSAPDFMNALKTKGKRGVQNLKPIFEDKEVMGHHMTIGLIQQKDFSKIYRTVLSGGGPFLLVDYEIKEQASKIIIQRKTFVPLCSNLKKSEEKNTATVSRDGQYTALFDPEHRTTKIYEIELRDGKSICHEVANTGIAAGKVDFSFDSKKLVLHLQTPALNSLEQTSLQFEHHKEILIAELVQTNGKIAGIGKISPLMLPPLQKSSNLFFPSFLQNGMLFYIREKIPDKLHRYEVATPIIPVKAVQTNFCALDPVGPKVLHAFPPKKTRFLESIAWMARPFPNRVNRPLLIGYAEFMEDGLEKNFLLDLKTGERLTVPGQGDPVATPDGNFLTIPGLNEGNRGLTFFESKPFLEALVKKDSKAISKLKPVFNDPEINGYCQSFGILKLEKNKTRYRTIHSRGGPFQLTEYDTWRENGKLRFERVRLMPLCENLPKREEHGTASISKDGNYISLYDPATTSTKIYSLEIQDGKSLCHEILNLGLPTGALDFSYDGKKIAFHVTFLDIDYADNTALGVPGTKIKDVIIAELQTKPGKTAGSRQIIGLGKIARLTTSQTPGVGSYFPSFLPNGLLFYVYHDNRDGLGERYRFEVINPREAQYEWDPFSKTPSTEISKRLLSKIALGRLWLKTCNQEPLTPTQSALYAMSLKPTTCTKLVQANWKSKKTEILSELKKTDVALNWKNKGLHQASFETLLTEESLLSACQPLKTKN